MPKVLILSASTGHGHNQAAKCLQKDLEASGYEVRIAEPLKEEGRVMETLIDDGYNLLATKLPKMYGKIYKITDQKYINKGIVIFFNKALGNTVNLLIEDYHPDLIISTHPILVNVVSRLKANGKIHLPFIAVVTDYMAHQFYVSKYVDAYIVASTYTKNTFIEKGISANKIFAYGIPIRKEFRQPRKVIMNKPFTLLIMGGSMGVPYMKQCLQKLINDLNDVRIIVVCGSNSKLRKELQEKYSSNYRGKEVIIYGFTSDIPELMDQSDVLVTKPGGLTISEAISKNIPMVIPFFIPGQEEENTEVLIKAGVAIRVGDSTDLSKVVRKLQADPVLLRSMIQKTQEISKALSPDNIVCLVDNLIYDAKTIPKTPASNNISGG
ncbi:MAG: galactosyldiacylglycerol synthase [Gracilibacter sp. BRH_c7a]|nr:MAG: galactosyldiacylglycerol synthase [Gracilibacter sp. BRH_c7a]